MRLQLSPVNHIFSCVACWHLIILWITERSVSDTSFRGLTNCGSMHVLVISCIIRFVCLLSKG